MTDYRPTPEQEAVLAHQPGQHARLLAGPGTLPRAITNLARPSASADTAPSPIIAPASLSEHHAARRYDQSIPRYSTTGPPLRGLRSRHASVCGEARLRRGLLHDIPWAR